MSAMKERQDYINFWLKKLAFKHDSDCRMVWVDIETTGLEPGVDLPLEIAMVVTDEFGNIVDYIETLMLDERGDYDKAVLEADPHVVRMHNASGLWGETAGKKYEWNIESAAVEIEGFLLENLVMSGLVPLSGSSVHFDRAWANYYFGGIMKSYFSHRNIDVSSIGEIAKMVYPSISGTIRESLDLGAYHRGLPDIIDSIRTYRYFLYNLFGHKRFDLIENVGL